MYHSWENCFNYGPILVIFQLVHWQNQEIIKYIVKEIKTCLSNDNQLSIAYNFPEKKSICTIWSLFVLEINCVR